MKSNAPKIDNDLKGVFFENAYSPFVILNRDMDFVDVNQAAVTTIGVVKENFIGKNILDLFPYLEGTERYDSYKDVLKTGVSTGFDELIFKGENAEIRFMSRAFKIGDYLGITTLDVTNVINTIDKLKSTETSLREVNKNLQRKNKELEDFSYAAAHDLRAPLTNLKSLLHMISDSGLTVNEYVPIVEKMKVVAKVMCDKIRALNEVIAIKSNFSDDKEEMVFSEVVSKIRAAYCQEIIEGRTIIKEDFSSCPKINYNPDQLEIIIQNLMSNTLKYRHPNRKLSIKITTKVIDGKTTFFFKDNGLGFEQNLADKIFGLFKRMHTHVEGLGIGLYIIHSVINRNGGEINVNSKINKGTEFIIQFK